MSNVPSLSPSQSTSPSLGLRLTAPFLLASVLVAATLNVAFAAPFSNGTKWPTYQVCYEIDATAAGFILEIDQSAQTWTAASTSGFAFYKDQSGNCSNYIAEGLIDGVGGWYGYTLIQTNNGQAGCDPLPFSCVPPTPGSTILSAYTVIEHHQCSLEDVPCICGAPTQPPEHDPLGCKIVTLPPNFCQPPGSAVPVSIPNTWTTANGNLRWNTPGIYETVLHELGHWLWLADQIIFFPPDRDSAMDFLAAQRCGDPGGFPDFYTLFSGDVAALNALYP
jgi:hypothetical protein